MVVVGSRAVGRAVLEPGWRWSVDVQPVVGTPSCPVHHFHVLLAGRLGVRMDDGEEVEFDPNDVMDIPPGHDAWVIGDEPVVLLDISGNVGDYGVPTSHGRALSTIVMSDIVDSTRLASELGDATWRQRLAEHNRVVRRQLDRFGGREVKTTGDGFLAVFNSAVAAVQCALAMADETADVGLRIRVGVHTGEIEFLPDDVRGIAVHTAARVMAIAGPAEVLVSDLTRMLVGSEPIEFEDRGSHELKGLTEPVHLFAAVRWAGQSP
jgi:class 3 adenylate cyclase